MNFFELGPYEKLSACAFAAAVILVNYWVRYRGSSKSPELPKA